MFNVKKTIFSIILLVIISFSFSFSQGGKKPAKILKNSGYGDIQRLDAINSKYPETNLSISPDGRYLFFMSENPSPWSTKDYAGEKGSYDGDIWYSQSVSGKWQKPKNIGKTINTPLGEDEPNVSPDGQTVYFQSWKNDWSTTGGPYYKAELSGIAWKNPVGLNSGITEFFVESGKSGATQGTDGATFSTDGKKFIVAYGAGMRSNMDLFISVKDSRGKWSKLKKLPVSTSYNERSPFLAADGKTLYFASDGYTGFGKLDIFKTTLNPDGTCGEVVNVGEPFNTKDDDYGFVLTATGNDAYFVRNGDIYYVDLKKADQDIKPLPTIILNGVVRDSVTRKPLEAIVKVKDKTAQTELGTSRSNANTGEYSIVLKEDKSFFISVNKSKYKDYSETVSVPAGFKSDNLKHDIELIPVSFKEPVIPIPQDTIVPIAKDTIPKDNDTVKTVTEIKNEPEKIDTPLVISIPPVEKDCSSKFVDKTHISLGLVGSIPLSVGAKAELIFKNFGFNISGLYLPQIGNLDETKPPEAFKSENNSTMFLAALVYHFPINCQFYPFAGLYYGIQNRHFKKYIPENSLNIHESNYSATHYGLILGSKIFFNESIFIEPAIGLGKNSVHDPYGNQLRYDFQIMGWLTFAVLFEI